ncbi:MULTISPECIES: zinc-dependent metalloprotease [Sphingobacterium]|uniref:zinc-dependent metalloprotease n=1 Tax=Sphingobacterium TaxID=28453 RepID=UPI00257AC47B|nr:MULTISPECIES: zinc-dependent metalloprotease [Sphingobacterium]
MKNKIIYSLLALLLSGGMAQGHQNLTPVDTIKSKNDLDEAYEKILKKKKIARSGVFNVFESDKKWYLEIPDSLLNRYFLTVTRLVSAPQGFPMYGGEKLNEQTLYFEKGLGDRIQLRAAIYKQDAPENDAIRIALVQSQEDPIIAILDIKGLNPAKNGYLIDVTDLFRKDNAAISFDSKIKSENKLSSLADDRSFITDMKVFPINLEVKTTKTYSSTSGTPAASLTGAMTFTTNTSMVLLPKVPMKKRIFDDRVGYFANKYILFTDKDQRSKALNFIQRYRLEPKINDVSRYLKGELVEPQKQIVYYIDPATPKKWRPYLIAGINDWNVAFEQAGFKNAIVGKEWPEQDTTMSLEDARFSVIRYFASEKANAYGPRISDPRSGEIIEAHVGWYHNVMKLVQQWFMVQVGPLNKAAQKMQLDDEVMGQLIRFVSSHEVGHSLGLRHNMGASSQTPVEKLRDKKWVEKHGHTVSIMDYARFNYVAQPEDNVALAGIYPRVGMYDKWAIQWGYQYLPQFSTGEEERGYLTKQVTDSLMVNPKLWFGGEGNNEDPRSQKEDLGDDSMLASTYGLKNLKRVVPQLIAWTDEPSDDYSNLKDMHKAVRGQFNRYLYHVLKNIGSQEITNKVRGQKGAVYAAVPKEKVKAAVHYVNDNVFAPPLWLYPDNIQSLIGIDVNKEINDQQEQMLNMLMSPGLLYNVYIKSLSNEDPYTLNEYLEDVGHGIWTLPGGDLRIDAFKRGQQRFFLERVNQVVNPKIGPGSDIITQAQRSDVQLYVRNYLPGLIEQINLLNAKQTDQLNKQHLNLMLQEIKRIQNQINKD